MKNEPNKQWTANEWRVSQRSLPAHGNGTRLLCATPEELDEMLEAYAKYYAASRGSE
jgi:hypothetical protein